MLGPNPARLRRTARALLRPSGDRALAVARRVLLCGAVTLGITLTVAPSDAVSGEVTPALHALLTRFRSSPGFSATFREEKHMTLLVAPLVAEGRISFAPPGTLLREVDAPEKSRLLLRDDELILTDASGQTTTLQLGAHAGVRQLVTGFLLLFRAEHDAITQSYHVDAAIDADTWALHLTAKAAPLASIVRAIDFRGDGSTLREIRITEVNGDQAVTTFTNVDMQRRFTPDERARLFAPPRTTP